MSASLVGSEMCIRDRSTGAGCARPSCGTPPAPPPPGSDDPTSAASHPQPVSYTHLTLPTICSV
eukprot:11824462-Alexandrium_andersonii.AAC.1